jgi:hypothetical protein
LKDLEKGEGDGSYLGTTGQRIKDVFVRQVVSLGLNVSLYG